MSTGRSTSSRTKPGLRVLSERCARCLFGPDPLVSADTIRTILADCDRTDTHFTCHLATARGVEVACAGFDQAGCFGGPALRFLRAVPDLRPRVSISLAELEALPIRNKAYARNVANVASTKKRRAR